MDHSETIVFEQSIVPLGGLLCGNICQTKGASEIRFPNIMQIWNKEHKKKRDSVGNGRILFVNVLTLQDQLVQLGADDLLGDLNRSHVLILISLYT